MEEDKNKKKIVRDKGYDIWLQHFRQLSTVIALLVSMAVVGAAAYLNWRAGARAIVYGEIIALLVLGGFLVGVVFKKFLRSSAYVAVLVLEVMLLYNASHLLPDDPGPLFGILALPVLAMTVALFFFDQLILSVLIFLGYFLLVHFFSPHLEPPTFGFKYDVIFFAILVLTILMKYVSQRQSLKLAQLAEDHSDAEMRAVESASDLKRANKKLLAVSKEKEQQVSELKKLNEMMVGREIKMAELKKEIKRMRSDHSEREEKTLL